MNDPILIAQGEEPIYLLPKMANRHGLIAGATGTGKTVTLQTLAENFSARGIPVFMADVKGDLAGMSQAGGNNPKVVRAREGARDYRFQRRSMPGRVLGCVRRKRPSRARDHFRDGAAPARSAPELERHAGRRPQHGLQDRRRERAAAARSERSALDAAVRGR